jgi:hypothetical protein
MEIVQGFGAVKEPLPFLSEREILYTGMRAFNKLLMCRRNSTMLLPLHYLQQE